MRISNVMNKAVVVNDNIDLREAAKIMSDRNIGGLIVLRKDKIVGIIAESDVLKNVSRLNSKVSTAMTKNVVTIDKSDTVDHASLVMKQNKIKRIPVLDKDKLVGIITATDIIAHVEDINEEFFID